MKASKFVGPAMAMLLAFGSAIMAMPTATAADPIVIDPIAIAEDAIGEIEYIVGVVYSVVGEILKKVPPLEEPDINYEIFEDESGKTCIRVQVSYMGISTPGVVVKTIVLPENLTPEEIRELLEKLEPWLRNPEYIVEAVQRIIQR